MLVIDIIVYVIRIGNSSIESKIINVIYDVRSIFVRDERRRDIILKLHVSSNTINRKVKDILFTTF